MALQTPRNADHDDGDADDLDDAGVFAEINITPLTDVVLVLLIIFMVASGAMVEAARSGQLDIELPRAGGVAGAQAASTLLVSVLRDGRMAISGEIVGDDEIARVLTEVHAGNSARPVVIEADGEVAHARVVHLLKLIQEAGFSNVGVAVAGEP